jgi:hypothetical protein
MRGVLILVLLAVTSPARAWEFDPMPICTLRHASDGGTVEITWDPARAEPYAIALTRRDGWPGGPEFEMVFEGPRGLAISTRRHRLSDGGTTLIVTDRGFGNLLDGLAFNDRVTADLAGARLGFPLAGAAGPVRDFRACAAAALASDATAGSGRRGS